MRRYGITLEQKLALIKSQKGRCALCGTRLSKNPSQCAVDHCHKSKKIRGVVHRGCNVALARLGDEKSAIFRLVKYFYHPELSEWLKDLFERSETC